MADITLISAPTCPFVQRAVIALKEKGVPFEVVYVDLTAKPDWFLALSPLGKVPVLKITRPGRPDAVLFESAVILEYLEEAAGGRPLHPADPLERAQHRSWIEFCSALLGDLWRMTTSPDADAVAAARGAARAKLERMEAALADGQGDGPFFSGPSFSYVDAVFAPAFRQIDTLEPIAPTGLLDGLPKVAAWARTLGARPSVRDAVPPDYAELFLKRLRQMGSRLLHEAAAA